MTRIDQKVPPVLRRFEPPDAPSIVTWPHSPAEAQRWAGLQAPWPIAPAVIQRWHTHAHTLPYVFHRNGLLLGYGELWVDVQEQEVELARIIVAPSHRGRGLGIALVRQLLAAAGRSAYPRTRLRVVPENSVAIACYRQAGFAPLSQADQLVFKRGQPREYLWMGCLAR